MALLDRLIRISLAHRGAVLLVAGLVLVLGSLWVVEVPVDVFPDLSAPTVTIITEAPGYAPEETELLVTFPIESAVNGAPGIRRLRSVSADGISVLWAEFEWGTEIYRARQIVSERLQRVELPPAVHRPELGPISSIMGEIAFIALTAREPDAGADGTGTGTGTASLMDLRRIAETTVKRRLLALEGVSQVVPIGGDIRELQVTVDPLALRRHAVSLDEVVGAVAAATASSAAGFFVDRQQEYLVRGRVRVREPQEIGSAVVRVRDGTPLRVGDLAEVSWGVQPARGTGSFKTRPAVVLSIQKQPDANTLELTRRIDRLLDDLETALPPGIALERDSFRQADFIEVAIGNVTAALRDGAILVVLVLFLFLGSWRTTLISALAIPLSLVAGVVVISAFGGTINTMTLGGLTIAIGALVDDAIIDVENVLRRLRGNRARAEGERRPALEVVFRGSSEVRKAIFFATAIIALVFVPLLVLPGLEGRLLRPLGTAYLGALGASLVVSLTLTPVLCFLLLREAPVIERGPSPVLRFCQRLYRPLLARSLRRPAAVFTSAALLLALTAWVASTLGRSFLPEFNEGSLTIGVTSAPGIPLAESDRLGRQVEETLLGFPEVRSLSRRTGRAERDEHVQGVNRSELEVVLNPLDGPLSQGRDKEELLAALREAVSTIPGVAFSFGQPISHRIDHMISGSRTNLAVKLHGDDLGLLRTLSRSVESVLAAAPGITDLSNQEQAAIPQLTIDPDRGALARYGVTSAQLAKAVEALFQGTPAGEVIEQGLVSRVVVRFPEGRRADRSELASLPVATSGGELVRLDQLAEVRFDLGPSLVRREDVQRVAVLSANVVGTDLNGVVERARREVQSRVDLPPGTSITFEGQFQEAARGTRNLALLGALSLLGMYALLYRAFGAHRPTLVVLVNLPLALIGGVLALALAGGVLSLASLVGFVTLFGIATRNGVLLVTHYQHLMSDEGCSLDEAVRRGSEERLAPILMTALTAGLALVPLVLEGDHTGNEIQSPMAVVILGGLVTSTLLNLVVVPPLFVRWGGRESARRES